MTFEQTVFFGLLAVWVLPPVLIYISVKRKESSHATNHRSRTLLQKVSNPFAYIVQKYFVRSAILVLDKQERQKFLENSKNHRIELQIRDKERELELLRLKESDLWDKMVSQSPKARKKAQKNFKKRKRKNERKMKKLQATTSPEHSAPDAIPRDPEDLKTRFADVKNRITELKDEITQLTLSLENAKALKESKISGLLAEQYTRKPVEDMVQPTIEIEDRISKEEEKAASVLRDFQAVPYFPNYIDAEKFRELVEQEKRKILEQRELQRARQPKKEDIEAAERLLANTAQFFDVRRKFHTFVANVDPDVERAFQRLYAQFETAQEEQQNSSMHEYDLRLSLRAQYEKLEALNKHLEELPPEAGFDPRSSKRATVEATIIDLLATLKSLRLKNQNNEKRLFEVAAIIERLYVSKCLLVTLPASMKDKFEAFSALVNAIYVYLSRQGTDNASVVNFAERIHRLENETLMAFIKIAKGDTQSLNAREVTKFKERMKASSEALIEEQKELEGHRNRWDEKVRELQALEDEAERLAIAEYKREEYDSILKTIKQSLEILTIISERNLPESGQNSAGRETASCL